MPADAAAGQIPAPGGTLAPGGGGSAPPVSSGARQGTQDDVTLADLPLGLPDDVGSAAILLAAEDRRELTDELRALTRSADPAVRARAALAVGRIGLPEGAARLMELTHDSDPGVRALAAFGAGLLELDLDAGGEPAIRRRLTEQLVALLDDASPGVVQEALWALGRHADAAATAPLRAVLGDGDLPEALAATALGAWWRLPDASIDAVTPYLGSASSAVRRAAAEALRRIGGPASMPSLESLLSDPDALVRAAALAGLRQAPAAAAHRHLGRLLADEDWRVVCGALDWVGALWSDEREKIDSEDLALVLRASLHRDRHVQRLAFAALALAARSYPVAADRLVRALHDVDAATRTAALDAISSAGGDLLDDTFDEVMQEYEMDRAPPGDGAGDVPARLAAAPLEAAAVVRVLAPSDRPESRPWLRVLADYGPAAARAEALQQAARTEPEAAAEAIAAALRGGSPAIQAVAAEALERIRARGVAADPGPGSEGWTTLMWNAQRGLGERGALEARLAVLDVLRALDRPAADLRASALLASPDRVVRLWAWRNLTRPPGARAATSAVAAAGPLATGRGEDDYRQLALAVLAAQAHPPRLEIETTRGTFVWELRADWAPLASLAFLRWAEDGFFDGLVFHRVVPDFVVQSGDPSATGHGGAAGSLRNEESPVAYLTGTVGLALAGRDTGSSQFFIVHSPQPHLDGIYPALGRVISGGAVERIQPGDAVLGVRVVR